MPAWNLILQTIFVSGSTITHASCAMFVVPGLPRHARIAFLAADPAARRVADDAHRTIEAQFATVVNLQKSLWRRPRIPESGLRMVVSA